MILHRISALAIGLACLQASGEVATTSAVSDSRVQSVRFEEGNVIRIPTAEGVATTIELSKKETILDFSMGDRDAWAAKHTGNLIVLKPKANRPDTNLTIYGKNKNYLFSLVTVPAKSKKVAWWVRVESPELELPTPESLIAAKRAADRKQITSDLQASKFEGSLNYDYWIVGPNELQPVAMHDNGRLTYMTFSAVNALPAPFVIEPDGSESLVDYHLEGDTMVLHRVVEKIVLRRGNQVAGITNRTPGKSSQSSPTGTASDKVQRVIKEVRAE